ncbi:hypothetical protein D9611_000681 [Ephemerocybe angulata]|uniref:Fungal-type protein kinase domain-containing protein n=1 Tax=Ephemerocybe angulata TaxID=980116 RepID=A0A8H5BM63_9AGAR|nr:hypothetical protein D9611_000681 [Tulosesus angulatus]
MNQASEVTHSNCHCRLSMDAMVNKGTLSRSLDSTRYDPAKCPRLRFNLNHHHLSGSEPRVLLSMNAAMRATLGTEASPETRSTPVENQAHAREGETKKRRAYEAELEPSSAARKMLKRTQQSRTAMQELEPMESSDVTFQLFYDTIERPVMPLADYAAEPTMFSSFGCHNHTMGFTVTGSMRDVCNPVYEYSVYPIQVEGCDFAAGEKAESEREVAVNLSWREMSRPYEKDLLSCILAEEVFEDIDRSVRQKAIREDNKAYKAQRPLARPYPVLVLLTKYEPISTITSMTEVELLNAFLALIYCHAVLWSIGIEHRDISEGNLMFDKTTKNPKLCDYDLSHLRGERRPSGYSNTGTWAFMAMELLTPAMDGPVARLYRHDFESFIAVLVWVVLRYRDGKRVPDPPLEEWVQNQFEMCAANRKHTFDHIGKGLLARPTWMTRTMWSIIEGAVAGLQVYIAICEMLAKKIRKMEWDAAYEEGDVDPTGDGGFGEMVDYKKPNAGQPSLASVKEELEGYNTLLFLDKVFESLKLFSPSNSRGPLFVDLLRTHCIDGLKKPPFS